MNMRIPLFLIISATSLLIAGCSAPDGEPTEFAKACDSANEKKYIEVSGYLADRGSVFCSNTGVRMECGFDLLESPSSDKKLRVDIEQGSGANTVDELQRGYKKEDIKIRDNSGNLITFSNKVKLDGKMSIAPAAGSAQGVCFMQVSKIER